MTHWLSRLLSRSHSSGGAGFPKLLERYDAYLRLLRANNEFLESLAGLDAAISAGGLCGWGKLHNTITDMNVQVFAMTKMLQGLSKGRYDDLLPVIEHLGREMQGILDQHKKLPTPGPRVISLAGIRAEGDCLVGGKAAHIAAFMGAERASIPKGLVVTTQAFLDFLRSNGLEERVLVLWDTLDQEYPDHLFETSLSLKAEALAAKLPRSVEEPLLEQMRLLEADAPAGAHFAVRSSASGEDSLFSFAGQYDTLLDVPASEIGGAVVKVFAGFFSPGSVMLRVGRGFGALELGMAALIMVMVEGRVSGVAFSQDPSLEGGQAARIEAVPGLGRRLVEGRAKPASFVLDRRSGALLKAEAKAQEPQAVLLEKDLRRILALAMDAERILKAPADIEWTIDPEGRLWLLQLRPTALRPASAPAGSPIPGHRVLAEGGAAVSPGAAAGTVVQVKEPRDSLSMPAKCVAVAMEARPELAVLLPRTSALVTERGGIASHLAAVAREFGVPAIFGMEGACGALPPGQVVTVDATSGRVYENIVETLLEREPARTLFPSVPNPLSEAFRELMPLVSPLNLLDPASPEFTPSGCRSLHDVVRFIHEKALAEVFRLPDELGGVSGEGLRILEPLPFDLRLVPLGSGIKEPLEGLRISLHQITSRPAQALFSGFADPAVRRSKPRPVDTAGFISVVSGSLAAGPDLGQPGWALLSDRYLHLSSRVGYHFACVEAFVGDHPAENRIRFTFKGGAADEPRRQRRARFLAESLDGMAFHVLRKGDFVSATFEGANQERMTRALEQLGRLLVCAGQLDMLMGEERLVAWYVAGFLDGDYARILEARWPGQS